MENLPQPTRQPAWIRVVQAAQCLLALIILGLSAWLIHGKYFDTIGYDIFCSLLTWLVVVFLLASPYMSALKALTHPFIMIGINAAMVLFWLAAMGATAHLRTTFKYNVTVYGCYDDGSSVDASTCLVGRAEVEKRAAIATSTGLGIMSGVAGLGAVEMLLFVALTVQAMLAKFKGSKTAPVVSTPMKQEDGYPMETAPPQQQPQYAPVMQQQQQQYAPLPEQPQQYAPPTQQYEPQGYEQQQAYTQEQYAPPTQGQAMPGPPGGYQSELPTPGH